MITGNFPVYAFTDKPEDAKSLAGISVPFE